MELRLLRYFLAVAEEGHVGRAADRLLMTQPPLSRALRQLSARLGVELYRRTPHGIELTRAGEILYAEAGILLDQADRLEARVRSAGTATALVVGSLGDTADLIGSRLLSRFRAGNPGVPVTVVETDLGHPAAGVRTGRVDVALTRTPFDRDGLTVRELMAEPVGVIVRDDDPLATAASVRVDELTDRRWIRLPDGTDPVFAAYWTGTPTAAEAPVCRTIQECLHAVLWNDATALAPLDQILPPGLTTVPVDDRPPTSFALVWRRDTTHPHVKALDRVARGG